MTIAPTLQTYLERKHVQYHLIAHEPTGSSLPTADACHIPGDCLAKGVVLRTPEGYMLAVLPASHRLQLGNLKAQLGESVDLATEHELDQLFRDCAPGAVPALGECYGLDVIVEDSIRDQPEVYLEGGDHATVVRMSQSEYARLTTEALHGRFGAHA